MTDNRTDSPCSEGFLQQQSEGETWCIREEIYAFQAVLPCINESGLETDIVIDADGQADICPGKISSYPLCLSGYKLHRRTGKDVCLRHIPYKRVRVKK